jgi:hypothetical protein
MYKGLRFALCELVASGMCRRVPAASGAMSRLHAASFPAHVCAHPWVSGGACGAEFRGTEARASFLFHEEGQVPSLVLEDRGPGHFRPKTFLAARATMGGQKARAIRAVVSANGPPGLWEAEGNSEL